MKGRCTHSGHTGRRKLQLQAQAQCLLLSSGMGLHTALRDASVPQAEGLAEWHSAQRGQTGFSGKLLLTKDFPGNQGLLPGQGWERTLGKQRLRHRAEYVIS